MKRVIFHRQASEELEDAVAYYESRAVGLGMDLKARVEKGQFSKFGNILRALAF